MGWFDGVVQCAPLSATCVLDWDAISAVATTAAVYFAWRAIRSENSHRNAERNRADQAQKDELVRMADERKSLARRLAKIFDRELSEAAREIIPLIKLVEHLTPERVSEFREIYAEPLNPTVFKMHERFVDRLDVFPDMLAIGIVNNMTNWSSITLFSEGLAKSQGVDLIRVRSKILAGLNELLEVIRETKVELEPYFADLPGLQALTLEQVREMNAAKAKLFDRGSGTESSGD